MSTIIAARAALAVANAKRKAALEAHPVAVQRTKDALVVTSVAWSVGSILTAAYDAASEILA